MSEQQVSEVKTTQRDPGRDQRIFTFKATYVIWLLLVMLEGLLALRIGLKLIGASETSPFVMLIYNASSIFVLPFMGLTGARAAGGAVLEISSLIGMLVYAFIFWIIERVVWVIFYRPREAPVAVTQRTSSEQHTR
jgi:hypothetical protein